MPGDADGGGHVGHHPETPRIGAPIAGKTNTGRQRFDGNLPSGKSSRATGRKNDNAQVHPVLVIDATTRHHASVLLSAETHARR